MNPSFAAQLLLERKRFAVRTNGVICAPAAGALYWAALAAMAPFLSTHTWCLAAFIGSGLIFPLALALQKPFRCDMMVKNAPLTGPGAYAYANIALGWAITIPAFHSDPQLVPLALGISTSLHLVGTAWSMNLKAYLIHPLLRAAIVVLLWYAFPEQRFLFIPLAITLLYIATIPFVLAEVAAHKKHLARSLDPHAATTAQRSDRHRQ